MSKRLSQPDYPVFLAALKQRILNARTTAARAVNHELILLYWDIGRGIVEKQQTAGWGDSVVERLAADLRAEFPDMRGFSIANLWRMKQMYLTHTSDEFLAQLVREMPKVSGRFLQQAVAEIIPRGHLLEPRAILQRPTEELTNPKADGDEGEFLSQAVREMVGLIPWGHHVFMMNKVKDPAARLYYLRATAQFGWSRSVLLNQIKAGAYERAVKEKKTHNFTLALPEHFAEQADEMMKSQYLNLLNEKERAPEDQSSIGIILCAEKDDIEVEFALKTKANPIGVAEYQLQAKLPAEFRGRLPTAKQLANVMREGLSEQPPKSKR